MDPLKFPEQFAYDQAVKAAQASGYKTINGDSQDVIINFKDTRLSPSVEDALSQITDLDIQLFDEEKTRHELEAVELRYKDDLENGRVGRRAAIGGPGDLVVFYISVAVNIVAPWIGKHVVSDFDDAAWEKLKKAFASIFKSAFNLDKKQSIAITTNYRPQIIFIFPCTMEPEIFSKELDELTKITIEILGKNADPKTAYKYTFNERIGSWELESGRLP